MPLDGGFLHFFNKSGIGVRENVSFLSSQRAARNIEVDPQVCVVSLYRHTDVLHSTRKEVIKQREEIAKKVRIGGGEEFKINTLMVAMWNGVAIPKTGMTTVSYFLSIKIFISRMSFSLGICETFL